MQTVGALQDAINRLHERRLAERGYIRFNHAYIAFDDSEWSTELMRRNLNKVTLVLIQFFECSIRIVKFIDALFHHALHHLIEAVNLIVQSCVLERDPSLDGE